MGKVGGDSTTYEVNVTADLGPLKALQEQAKALGSTMQSMASGAGGGLSSMASGAMAAGAAIMSVAKAAADAATQLISMASEGAKLQTMEAAFKGLGSSAEDLKKLRDLTGGLVSDADLMEAFNLAKLFKIPSEEVPKLVKLAQGASAALGTTTAKALSDTFTAASRQSKMIADNMGIVIGDMGKMYEDFAKKRGKSAKDLTDQERMLAFTQKMVAEGGRQMALADIAQGNMAAKAAASYDNLSNSLKVSVAEMFGSMGIWDMLGGVMATFQGAVNGSGSNIKDVLIRAFKGLVEIAGRVVSAFAPTIGIIESFAKVIHILNGALIIVGPVVQGILFVFQKLSSFLIDVVSGALEGIIRGAAAAAGLFDDDLSRSLTEAADEIAKARTVSLEFGSALDTMGAAAAGVVPNLDAAAASISGVQNATTKLPTELERLQGKLSGLNWTGATATRQQLLSMSGDFKYLADQAQASGMSVQESQRAAASEIAKQMGVSESNIKDAAGAIISTYAEMEAAEKRRIDAAWAVMKADTDAAKVAEQRAKESALANIAIFENMYGSAYEQAGEFTTLTGEIWAKAGDDEKRAAEELEAWRLDMIAKAAAAYGEGSQQFAGAVAKISDTAQRAFSVMGLGEGKDKEDKKPRGVKIDWAKRDYDVLLMLATDHERQKMEIERTHSEAVKNLRKGDVASEVQIKTKMYAELLKLEVDAGKARQEAAFQVQTYLMSQGAAEKAMRLKEIRDEAEQMRAIVRAQGGDTGAIDIRERELVGEEEAKGGPFAMFGQLQEANAGMWGAYRERAQEEQNQAEADAQKHTEQMAKLFQGMGSSIGDSFVAIAAGGADMREQTFKLMGSLFAQLSTAFLAWASAESSLLMGNPFGAAAAAIALGVVGSAISSFGSRGKGGGGASGGTAAMSRQSLERKRDDKDKEPGVVIYNYGFSTPDQIARSVTRGDMRGRDLDGRKRAS